jgi:hypothetical protein
MKLAQKGVRAIAVNIFANVKSFQKGIKQAQKDLKKFSRDVESAGRFMTKNITMPAVAMGVAIAANVKKMSDFGSSVFDMSQKLDVSTQSIQEFEYIASQMGTSLETFMQANNQLMKSMRDAQKETSAEAMLFKALKVEIKNADGTLRSTEEVFWDVRGAIASMTDTTSQAMVAEKLFSRSYQDMLRVIRASDSELDQMRARFKGLGIEVGEKTIKDLNDFSDEMAELKLVFRTVAAQIASVFLPLFRDISSTIRDSVIPNIREFISSIQEIDPSKIKEVAINIAKIAMIGPALLVVAKTIGIISGLLTFISKIAGMLGSLKGMISGIAIGAKVSFGVMAAKIIAVGLLIGALIKGIIDFIKINEESADGMAKMVQALKNLFLGAFSLIMALFDIIAKSTTILLDDFSGTLNGIVRIFGSTFDLLTDIFSFFTNLLTGNFAEAGKAIVRVLLNSLKVVANAVETVVNAIGNLLGIKGDFSWISGKLDQMVEKFAPEIELKDIDKTGIKGIIDKAKDMLKFEAKDPFKFGELPDLKEYNVDMNSLMKTFGDQEKQTQQTAKATDNFKDSVSGLANSIRDLAKSFFDMGNAFSLNVIEKMSPARIKAIVSQNTRQMEAWNKSLAKLEQRGVSQELVSSLRGMGVAGLGISAGIEGMTAEQIKNLESMFGTQRAIATEQAIRQTRFEQQKEIIKDQVININIANAETKDPNAIANEIVRQLRLAGI